nr:unnamed protein product [Digitaria exilis]
MPPASAPSFQPQLGTQASMPNTDLTARSASREEQRNSRGPSTPEFVPTASEESDSDAIGGLVGRARAGPASLATRRPHPATGPESFADDSRAVVDFLAEYYRDVDKYPVRAADLEPGRLRKLLPDTAPELGEPLEHVLEDVRRDILPGLTHWQSPSFFAYFPMNASAAGFAGEMLSVGLNVVPFLWAASPAAAELEGVVVDWMGNLLGLPRRLLFSGGGGGVLQGSTCEAVVCTLAAARDRALAKLGAHEAIMKLVVYASDQTHATFQKGARLVGIPPANFRVIPTSAASGYGLTAAAVRALVDRDVASGLVPLYLCATVGTTGLGAVDPVRELGEVARRHGMWLHVDAAYAGSAAICPEFQGYLDGTELADSVSMNPHKWFLTNMDCCCLWVASPRHLTSALSTDPEYLKNVGTNGTGNKPAAAIDYKDWQISLSRRFRAIKLWVVLRRYGAVGLRGHIRRHVTAAKWFEPEVAADERCEVVVPRRFSLVCFRLRPRSDEDAVDDVNRELLAAVNESGRAFMTHFVVDGKFVIRLAIGGAMTELRHVMDVWELIKGKAVELGGSLMLWLHSHRVGTGTAAVCLPADEVTTPRPDMKLQWPDLCSLVLDLHLPCARASPRRLAAHGPTPPRLNATGRAGRRRCASLCAGRHRRCALPRLLTRCASPCAGRHRRCALPRRLASSPLMPRPSMLVSLPTSHSATIPHLAVDIEMGGGKPPTRGEEPRKGGRGRAVSHEREGGRLHCGREGEKEDERMG